MAVNASDDKRRADDEARIAQLYRLGSVEEPPARIDAAVAAAARRPADSSSRRRSAPWWHMWRVPFAVAAVAVVSVSLVTLMLEEGGERLTRVPESLPPVVAERDAVSRKEPPAETPPAKSEVPTQERRSQSPEAVPKRAAPTAAERKDDTTGTGPSRREAVVAQEAQRSSADTSTKTLQKAPMAEAPPTMQESAGSNVAGAASAGRARVEPQTPEAFPAAADRAALPPAAALKPAPAPRATIGIRGLESAELARPSPEVARHIVQLENQPPSVWIERIATLRKEGRLAEADGVVAEFKRRFPYEPLPPSLQ